MSGVLVARKKSSCSYEEREHSIINSGDGGGQGWRGDDAKEEKWRARESPQRKQAEGGKDEIRATKGMGEVQSGRGGWPKVWKWVLPTVPGWTTFEMKDLEKWEFRFEMKDQRWTPSGFSYL